MIMFENDDYRKNVSNNLYFLYQNLKKIINTGVATNNITEPQLNVLKALTLEDGLSLKELSQRVGLAHSTVSGIVDRLERRNLLKRKVNPNDKRHTCIYLSDMVNKYKDSFSQQLFIPIIEKLTLLSRDEQTTVIEGLSVLNRILRE